MQKLIGFKRKKGVYEGVEFDNVEFAIISNDGDWEGWEPVRKSCKYENFFNSFAESGFKNPLEAINEDIYIIMTPNEKNPYKVVINRIIPAGSI